MLESLISTPPTLVHAILATAETEAGITLVGENDHEVHRPWHDLLLAARRRAAGLRKLGIERGEPVVIVLDTSFEFVETFVACQLIGAVPTPAYPPTAMARLSGYITLLTGIAKTTRARVLVTDARIRGAIAAVRKPAGLRHLVDVATLDGEPEPIELPSPDDLGLIQCTSGSTSAPKPVALSHKNLMSNVGGMMSRYSATRDDAFISWLPLYHDMGLIGQLMTTAVTGAHLVTMSPATFLLDPAAWWRAAHRHRGTVTAAPCFAYGLSARRCTNAELAGLDLSSFRVILSGAEPIIPTTIRTFFQRFEMTGIPSDAFMAAYGLAESCVGVACEQPGTGLVTDFIDPDALNAAEPRAIPAQGHVAIEVVCLGRAFPGAGVVVRDANGQLLPDRTVGEIYVTGPSVMTGYLHHPEATAETIRNGELKTGDLGYMVDGRMFLVGRKKHMLIVRGRNYYAEAIEAIVERVPGVRKGNAVAFGVFDERRGTDQLWIACETREKDKAKLETAIAELVSEEIGLMPARICLLKPNQLPKTSSGKKQRLECRAMLTGDGPTVASGKLSGAMSWLRSQLSIAELRLQKLAS
jgi:acyl-CoA synthetase (AMP-forming)/AMP-acid ligase II